MCYEVFNRSAAQTYLRAIRRQRREEDGPPPDEPEAKIKFQREVQASVFSRIDWATLANNLLAGLRKYWKVPIAALILLSVGTVALQLLSATFWYEHVGRKLTYAFPVKTPLVYLVGMKQNVKIWSERQGRLDTPMEKRSTDEMGNLVVQRLPAKGKTVIQVSAREWIQILNEDQGSTSRNIPSKHPSLVPGKILLDKQGTVLERRANATPRIGKSLGFLALRMPKGMLKAGRTWSENVQWTDEFNGWKVAWAGKVTWTLGIPQPCRQGSCTPLTAMGDLRPTLVDTPVWATGAMGSVNGKASLQSRVLFDPGQKRLVSHAADYQGLLRVPIRSLERIPMELRVGRRVKGPGEIALYIDGKVDLQLH